MAVARSVLQPGEPRDLGRYPIQIGLRSSSCRGRASPTREMDDFLGDWPGSLVGIGNASLEALRDRIRSEAGGFTHIYVLAHGIGQPAATEGFDLLAPVPPSSYLALQKGNDIGRCSPGDLEQLFEARTRRPAAFISRHLRQWPWPPDIRSLATSDFRADTTEPNGSSIAFLAEVGDKAALFAADAHAPVLENSIRRLLTDRGKEILRLDAYKMSHHGSAANNSLELGQLLDCPLYLVSTNGSRHGHPDHEAMARMLWSQDSGVTFAFNYRSDENEPWEDEAVRDAYDYQTIYPEGDSGLRIHL